MFTVSKTFDVVTPESAEHGDIADSGFEYQDRAMTLREVLRTIESEGCTEPSSWPCTLENFANGRVWFTSVDPDVDYRTGESTTYAIHVDGSSRNLARLYRFLSAKYPRAFRNC